MGEVWVIFGKGERKYVMDKRSKMYRRMNRIDKIIIIGSIGWLEGLIIYVKNCCNINKLIKIFRYIWFRYYILVLIIERCFVLLIKFFNSFFIVDKCIKSKL